MVFCTLVLLITKPCMQGEVVYQHRTWRHREQVLLFSNQWTMRASWNTWWHDMSMSSLAHNNWSRQMDQSPNSIIDPNRWSSHSILQTCCYYRLSIFCVFSHPRKDADMPLLYPEPVLLITWVEATLVCTMMENDLQFKDEKVVKTKGNIWEVKKLQSSSSLKVLKSLWKMNWLAKKKGGGP